MDKSHELLLLGLESVVFFVEDIEQSKRWYMSVLGLKPTVDRKDFVEFRFGAGAMGLHPSDEKSGESAGCQVGYFRVINFDSAVERFVSHGGDLYRGPLRIENGKQVCQIRDPFGNILGLIG